MYSQITIFLTFLNLIFLISNSVYGTDSEYYLIEEIHQDWENNDWTNRTRASYKYNNIGQKIETLLDQWDNSEWDMGNKYEYTYDNKGNEIINKFYHGNTEKNINLTTEAREYGQNFYYILKNKNIKLDNVLI